MRNHHLVINATRFKEHRQTLIGLIPPKSKTKKGREGKGREGKGRESRRLRFFSAGLYCTWKFLTPNSPSQLPLPLHRASIKQQLRSFWRFSTTRTQLFPRFLHQFEPVLLHDHHRQTVFSRISFPRNSAILRISRAFSTDFHLFLEINFSQYHPHI